MKIKLILYSNQTHNLQRHNARKLPFYHVKIILYSINLQYAVKLKG